MKLTKDSLIKEAELFCARESIKKHPELLGINDGKSIGTFIEHEFKKYLESKYEFNMGSSAQGIDFPDKNINTDLKVTSSRKPQNSCPFRDARQKIYGLGYNILLFIYSKRDDGEISILNFESCTFIEADETGDYILTKNLIKMVENKWDKEKILYYLKECNLPCDDNTLSILTDEIMENPPKQGFLTISNAFQWRLKYTYKSKKEDLTPFSKKEYGDYQTPLIFAKKVLEYVNSNFTLNPDLIIEPTCGVGNFIKASKIFFPESHFVGIDIKAEYIESLKEELDYVELYNDNIFEYDFEKIMRDFDEYLLIGNPPWVNNTNLSKFKSDNLPVKNNIKNYNQFEAKTGMSNFDVSENIILHIINTFKEFKSTMIFLCKYTVACNIFEYLVKTSTFPARINIIKFDAMKIFGIDASACILIMQFNKKNKKITSCNVSDMNNPHNNYRIGIKNGELYSNIDNEIEIDGKCCYEWRQGIKHDCVNIMELEKVNDKYQNKKGDTVDLEDGLIYPLLKSSNLKKPVVTQTNQNILITQFKLKEDTNFIKEDYPLIWKYLTDNREYFEKRKSSIYEKAPPYSIFGIGDYTFKKYKVAISGFYKKGLFTLVYHEKSIMLDDTCYYLSFDNYDEAYITMLILNSDVVQSFLKSIVFLDSKRPYSKKVLKRIDIKKALKLITLDDLIESEEKLELENYVNDEMFESYREKIFKKM